MKKETVNNSIWLAHASIIGVNIIHSFNYIIAKDVMPEYVKPFGFIILRVIGSLLLFWIASLFIKHDKIEKQDWPRLLICSIFGVGLNQILFLKGLSLASPIDSSIMMSCTPILVLALSAFLLKESLQRNQIWGVLLGFAGALLLILNRGKVNYDSDSFTGNLLIFLNALSWGLYLVLAKPLMLKYHPIAITKWTFLLGCPWAIPYGATELIEINWMHLPFTIVMGVAYVIVFTTFVAYFLNMYGLKLLSPAVVSFYIYIQPVCTALIALVLGKDSLTIIKIVATTLIFLGVYLVNSKLQLKKIP